MDMDESLRCETFLHNRITELSEKLRELNDADLEKVAAFISWITK